MGDAHSRFGAVNVLPPGTAGAVDIGPQIGGVDIDVDVVIDFGRNEHG